MKFKIAFLLMVTTAMMIPVTGCTDSSQPRLEQPFWLSQGSTVKIAGQKLSLKFDEVTLEGRCPQNVVCTWEGEARCAVTIDDGTPTPVTLTVPGLTWDYAVYEYKNYVLEFKLDPYPIAGEQIPQSDYRLYMIVSNAK